MPTAPGFYSTQVEGPSAEGREAGRRSRGKGGQANGCDLRELFVSTAVFRRSAKDAALAPVAHVIK